MLYIDLISCPQIFFPLRSRNSIPRFKAIVFTENSNAWACKNDIDQLIIDSVVIGCHFISNRSQKKSSANSAKFLVTSLSKTFGIFYQIYHIFGFLLIITLFIAISITFPTMSTFSSQRSGPRICSPTGRSIELSSVGDANPTGIVSPGIPASDAGIVNISSRYRASGSVPLAPIFQATVGAVGVTMTSTNSNALAKSWRINSRTAVALRKYAS